MLPPCINAQVFNISTLCTYKHFIFFVRSLSLEILFFLYAILLCIEITLNLK